jgi:hypothetical protein
LRVRDEFAPLLLAVVRACAGKDNMAKQRDWIDYANLGSNLFQNLQLSGVQDKLGAMASVAGLEQAKAEHEDRLRENVFEADTLLRELRARPDTERAGVLALATFTLATFKWNDVTSASFRSFEDKERLRAVLEGFKALVSECESKLSADERAEALLCARYMENPAVKIAVPAELTEQLRKAQQDLSELTTTEKLGSSTSSERDALSDWGVVGFLFGLLLLFIGAMEKPGPKELDGGTSSVVIEIGVTLCALSGVALVLAFVAIVKHKHAPQTRKRLADAAEAKRVNPAKEEEVNAFEQRIKNEIAKQRIVLERERDALMAKVLKLKEGRNPFVASAARQTSESDALPKDTSGVWAFGPGLPPDGTAFGSLTDMLGKFRRYGFTQDRGEDKIDELLNKGFIIIEKNNSGETQVFANRLSLKVKASAVKQVMAYLGVDEHTPIVHKTRYGAMTGNTITLQNLL